MMKKDLEAISKEAITDLGNLIEIVSKYSERTQVAMLCALFDYITESNDSDKISTLLRISSLIIKVNDKYGKL